MLKIIPVLLLLAQYQIRFGADLRLPGDLRIAEPRGTRTVRFLCASGRKPAAGSALHLFLEHSPGLDGNRSFLSVSLNYGVLRSIGLEDSNRRLSEIVIPVPANLLKPENDLAFTLEQWPAEGAWTTISARSYLSIAWEPGEPVRDLGRLPAPLVDPYSYEPKVFDVLLPAEASSPTLEAAALVVAGVAARVPAEAVSVNVAFSPGEAKHPLLVVGTPLEQPDLRKLRRPWGQRLAVGEGAAGIVNSREGESPPLVYVTGGSPQGVWRAARGLVAGGPHPGGPLMRIANDPSWKPAGVREWQGYVPPRSRFSLADLGYRDWLPVGAQDGTAATVPLDAPPDVRLLPYGAQMTLWFRFGAGAGTSGGQIFVEFNGVRLRRIAESDLGRKSADSVTIPIPGRLLETHNLLRVFFEDKQGAPAYLLPNSQFYLPRDYRADLPDLSLLRIHLYPFSVQPDLADTIVVLPDALDAGVFGALVKLAAGVGRLAPYSWPAFHVRRAAELRDWEKRQYHFIFLRVAAVREASVEESVSPWNGRKFVLSIQAKDSADLEQAVERLFAPGGLDSLRGDTAYLGPEGILCVSLRPKVRIEETYYLTRLEAWLRANWLALPVILALASGILFVGLRLVLERYKSTGSLARLNGSRSG